MYHSVADVADEQWIDPQNHVPANVFAEQMAYLAKHRKVVSLDDLVRCLDADERIEDGTVALTFDDGYLDNLTVAAPILDHLNLPATIFLPTGYIERGETQWIDQAYTAFHHRTQSVLSWGAGFAHQFSLDNVGERSEAYRIVCRDLLRATSTQRRALLEHLVAVLAPDAQPPRLTMNWTDVHELVTKYPRIQIGGHTVEHLDLTSVPLDSARTELLQCASHIEQAFGHRPRYFSFCYGRSNDHLRAMIEPLGIDAAFGGSRHGPIIRAGAERLRLPRIEAPRTIADFAMLTSSMNSRFWRRLGR
ncbi:MAG: polysaccharide deacetylase family protein [Gammaproteobacteria bacterium]|nr:polysaccharide deacetylase family protein [Gammaproteobacteria bacterium]